jgi:hypothetical protein
MLGITLTLAADVFFLAAIGFFTSCSAHKGQVRVSSVEQCSGYVQLSKTDLLIHLVFIRVDNEAVIWLIVIIGIAVTGGA